MQLILLEEQAQLDQLKKDDVIIVKWNPGSFEYKKNCYRTLFHDRDQPE